MEEGLEDLVHQGVRHLHAKPGENREDERPFPDDHVLPVPEGGAEAYPGEGGGKGHQEDVLADLGVAELNARHFREDGHNLVTGQDPCLADDFEADAHRGQEDRQEDEDDLHQVGRNLHILQEPDAGVAQVAEDKGGEQL